MTAAELRAARFAFGYSQATMAEKIGRSHRHYKAYELGECEIPLIVERAVAGLQLASQVNSSQEETP